MGFFLYKVSPKLYLLLIACFQDEAQVDAFYCLVDAIIDSLHSCCLVDDILVLRTKKALQPGKQYAKW